MRSASVPSGTGRQAAACILFVAIVAGLSVLARVLQLDESFSVRALWLAAIAAEGGAIAAAAPALALASIRRGGAAIRGAVGAITTGLAFIPACLACFAFKIRILDGRIEGDLADGIASGQIIFSLIGAMGMFTPTGLRYLAPWPLAATSVAAGLVFSRWPQPRPLPE